ncbi:CU044_5270 family protein [Nonomuraea ferruginea]|uniref:CU044_5270 family protein n=1 Tax=Nonomuraea ferruginea TaxID=46174 RepID=A0ABT4T892_9ACTN|nr:CU044_5270 family protein [Nonomuraea ferruginea]MDA0645741.1 CU044_5270 family protein [Nonomuraea ferruginea]
MTDRMVARLRPDELDELAEASYRRRRREDLARTFSSTRNPAPAPRRPLFLLATGAVAAVAAGAVVVSTGVLSGTPAGDTPPVAASSTPESTTGGTGASPATRIDARSFLLAAAATALREPAATGDYWYVRQRTTHPTAHLPEEFWTEARKLQLQEQAEVDRTGAEDDELVAINEKYNKKLENLRKSIQPDGPPYRAYIVESEERWRPKRIGGTHRVKSSDREVVFPSPQDEAKWKEEGSPKLAEDKPKSVDDNLPRPLSIPNMDITMQNVGDLPTSKKALAGRLRAQFAKLPDPHKEFDLYLWQTTVDLMTAPTTPGTRAAIFRILADQPGITSHGEVADATGRAGVGLAVESDDGYEFQLVVDEDTAELLEYSVAEKDEDTVRVTFEEFGWTDKLGRRPQR